MSRVDYLVLNKAKLYNCEQKEVYWRESAVSMVQTSSRRIFWLGTHAMSRLVRGFFWWTVALVKSLGDSYE